MKSPIQIQDEKIRGQYSWLVNAINKCKSCELSNELGFRDIGDGCIPCDLMFIGEAFGLDERNQGRPFVGKSGGFLRKRCEVNKIEFDLNTNGVRGYISNSICCWPPPAEGSKSENGKPTEDSIVKCKYFLWQKIRFASPKVIVPLGEFATKLVLKIGFHDKFRMTDYVGKVTEVNWRLGEKGGLESKISIVPLFHPSYVLHKGESKELIELYDIILGKCYNYIKNGVW